VETLNDRDLLDTFDQFATRRKENRVPVLGDIEAMIRSKVKPITRFSFC